MHARPRMAAAPNHPHLMPRQVLLLGQDLPGGNYAALRRAGSLPRPNSGREFLAAVKNYRTWILTALYGFSFGMELTMNNGEGCTRTTLAARRLGLQ